MEDTSGPLEGGRRYYLRYNNALDHPVKFDMNLFLASYGTVRDPHLLVVNEEFDGEVGSFLAGDLERDTNKSFYRFTAPPATLASQGNVTVEVTDYPCGGGVLASELELRLYELDGGFFSTFLGTPLQVVNSGADCRVEIKAPVTSGLTYLIGLENRKPSTSRPSPEKIRHTILVRRE